MYSGYKHSKKTKEILHTHRTKQINILHQLKCIYFFRKMTSASGLKCCFFLLLSHSGWLWSKSMNNEMRQSYLKQQYRKWCSTMTLKSICIILIAVDNFWVILQHRIVIMSEYVIVFFLSFFLLHFARLCYTILPYFFSYIFLRRRSICVYLVAIRVEAFKLVSHVYIHIYIPFTIPHRLS